MTEHYGKTHGHFSLPTYEFDLGDTIGHEADRFDDFEDAWVRKDGEAAYVVPLCMKAVHMMNAWSWINNEICVEAVNDIMDPLYWLPRERETHHYAAKILSRQVYTFCHLLQEINLDGYDPDSGAGCGVSWAKIGLKDSIEYLMYYTLSESDLNLLACARSMMDDIIGNDRFALVVEHRYVTMIGQRDDPEFGIYAMRYQHGDRQWSQLHHNNRQSFYDWMDDNDRCNDMPCQQMRYNLPYGKSHGSYEPEWEGAVDEWLERYRAERNHDHEERTATTHSE